MGHHGRVTVMRGRFLTPNGEGIFSRIQANCLPPSYAHVECIGMGLQCQWALGQTGGDAGNRRHRHGALSQSWSS